MRFLVVGLLLAATATGAAAQAPSAWQPAPAEMPCFARSPTSDFARVAACERVIDGNTAPAPVRGWALMVRAMARAGAGQSGPALQDLADAAAALPGDPMPLAIRAEMLGELRRHVDSAEAWTEVLALRPDNAEALVKRAMAWSEVPRMDAALADISAALHLSPDDPAMLGQRAAILSRMGDYRRALADLDLVVATQPESATPLWNRASLRLQMGDLAGAAEDASAAISARPPFSYALATRCVARWRQHAPGALADCDLAIGFFAPGPQTHDWPHFARAGVRLADGDTDGALADVEASLANAPWYPNALWLRGLVKQRRGQDGGADFAAARAADPRVKETVDGYFPTLAR